jgi:formylglycine-generating enzyme required for sulfatase activity
MRGLRLLALTGLAIASAWTCTFDFEVDGREYECNTTEDCGLDGQYICDEQNSLCILKPIVSADVPNPCPDLDKDGYSSVANDLCCPSGASPPCQDENDGQKSVHPGANEICDGLDNDQDGLIDTEDADAEGGYIFQDCPKRAGVCLNAKKRCGGEAGYLDCSFDDYFQASNGTYAEEEGMVDAHCNDTLDNDCDTVTDNPERCGDTCVEDVCQACQYSAFGECAKQDGEKCCSNGAWGECVGAIGPEDERCDGLDNDCDSRKDEGPDETVGAICGDCAWNTIPVGDWCMDRFEAVKDPTRNPEAGDVPISLPGTKILELEGATPEDALPWVNVNFAQASQACLRAGKELCPREAWEEICRSESVTTYPYGDVHQPNACNGSSGAAQPPGSLPTCASIWPSKVRGENSDTGNAYDMSGNVEEWVSPPENPADRFAMGGSFESAGNTDLLRCNAGPNIPNGVAAPNRGFRCCKQFR